MKRSLQGQLLRALGMTILVTGILAGMVSFRFSYDEGEDFQDDTLRQIAALVDTEFLRQNSGLGLPIDRDIDPETRILVSVLPSRQVPWISSGLPAGFHTVQGPEGAWRVFIRPGTRGKIAVAQVIDARDDLALHSALWTLVPLLLLLLLLMLLVAHVVRRELAVLPRLARELDHQSPEQPEPLSAQAIPSEVVPFMLSINQLLARIRTLMEAQRRFIADAAHEMRSPLTALLLQVQNLEQSAPSSLSGRIKPLKEGIVRTCQLVEQLLSHARSQVGSTQWVPVSCFQLGRTLVSDLMPLAEARHMDLGLECPGALEVVSDPQLLPLILRNALDNALRYAPEGSEVTLRIRAEGADCVFEVEDAGPGIPEDEKIRVFDPFHRVVGSNAAGSGLGLTIAREAAQRLGGAVSLQDRAAGRGLIFCYRQRPRRDFPPVTGRDNRDAL